jgi:hypothetical protein
LLDSFFSHDILAPVVGSPLDAHSPKAGITARSRVCKTPATDVLAGVFVSGSKALRQTETIASRLFGVPQFDMTVSYRL